MAQPTSGEAHVQFLTVQKAEELLKGEESTEVFLQWWTMLDPVEARMVRRYWWRLLELPTRAFNLFELHRKVPVHRAWVCEEWDRQKFVRRFRKLGRESRCRLKKKFCETSRLPYTPYQIYASLPLLTLGEFMSWWELLRPDVQRDVRGSWKTLESMCGPELRARKLLVPRRPLGVQ